MTTESKPLISVITPVYNSELYIQEAIASVQAQTYTEWEMIIIDDGSVDRTIEAVEKMRISDDRIKLVVMAKNEGVAGARNAGLASVRGRFVAFLDADDTWHKDKLAAQLALMSEHARAFTFTGYAFTNRDNRPTGVVVSAPVKTSFSDYLRSNIIWTSTVMVDLDVIAKDDLMMEDLRYGEDAKTWLKLLDKYGDAFGLNVPLSYYRRGGVTLSSNKVIAVTRKLKLYLSIENLSSLQSIYYFLLSTAAACRKRL